MSERKKLCRTYRRLLYGTVPILNFCTKYMGSPGLIHDLTPDSHLIDSDLLADLLRTY